MDVLAKKLCFAAEKFARIVGDSKWNVNIEIFYAPHKAASESTACILDRYPYTSESVRTWGQQGTSPCKNKNTPIRLFCQFQCQVKVGVGQVISVNEGLRRKLFVVYLNFAG